MRLTCTFLVKCIDNYEKDCHETHIHGALRIYPIVLDDWIFIQQNRKAIFQFVCNSLVFSLQQRFSKWEAGLPKGAPNCFRGCSVNESEKISH